MDGPVIEEIVGPPDRSRRARNLAHLFGVPGLTVMFVFGTVTGIAAGTGALHGPTPSHAASSAAPVGSGALSPIPSAPGDPGSTTAATPSPTPRRGFDVTTDSLPSPLWPGPIRELIRSAPGWLSGVRVLAPADGAGDWTVRFSAGADAAAWVAALPSDLRSRGFSAVDAAERPGATALWGPGLEGTITRAYGAGGRPIVVVALRISPGSLAKSGFFTDDPSDDLTRQGCDPVRLSGLDAFALELTMLGGRGVAEARCPGGVTGGPDGYAVAGRVQGDPLVIADALAAAYARAGVDVRASSWVQGPDPRQAPPALAVGLIRTHLPAGGAAGPVAWWFGAASLVPDPYAPGTWQITIHVAAFELGPDGRLLPDGLPWVPTYD